MNEKQKQELAVKQEQHRMFQELIKDLETRTPETMGIGWMEALLRGRPRQERQVAGPVRKGPRPDGQRQVAGGAVVILAMMEFTAEEQDLHLGVAGDASGGPDARG